MRKKATFLFLCYTLCFMVLLNINNLNARKLYYLEEFYQLYYLPNKFNNQDLARNIHWLQVATNRPFSPPIHAIVIEDNEVNYEKYQQLLVMHIHYLLTKNFVYLAARFDKHKPVFFNRPYSKDILASLDIAEYLYNEALREWKIVLSYYDKITQDPKFRKIKTKLSFSEDMLHRINTEELDYARVIKRRLGKINEAIEYFKVDTKLSTSSENTTLTD